MGRPSHLGAHQAMGYMYKHRDSRESTGTEFNNQGANYEPTNDIHRASRCLGKAIPAWSSNGLFDCVGVGASDINLNIKQQEIVMKITLYYYYNTSAWAIDPIDISTFERDKKYSPNNIYIKEEIVSIPDVEVPSRAFITKEMVTMLEAQNQEILAEAQMKIQVNKNKIQSLLCIEAKEA